MGAALVTGARGFVGAWLAKALLERGRQVVSLDRAGRRAPRSTLGLLGIEGEVVDRRGRPERRRARSRGLLREHGVERRSSTSPPRRSSATVAESPLRGFETNVRGTWTAARRVPASRGRAGRRRLLGQGLRRPRRAARTARTSRCSPTAPYEASKAAADMIARSYWHGYGLAVAVTRFANIYGGGDLNFSRIIPEAVCAAVDGRRAGAALRRFARARLPLRRGRRRCLHGDRALRSIATRCAARRSTPAAVGRTGSATSWRRSPSSPGPGVEPEVRGRAATRQGEIDRQYVDADEDPRAPGGWSRRSTSRRGSSGRSSGIGTIRRRVPDGEPLGLSEARPAGFEPATSASGGRRSIH